MSWPSSLSHTASLGYLPSGDSHRLQERVGSCSEPPESAQALTCPHPSCSATSRDLFSLLGQSPSAKLFTSLPFSLPPAYLCLSLQERKAFLSHSLLQLPRRPTFLKKWTWLCRPRCNLVLSGTIPWEQLPKVIADLLVAKSRGWVESLSDLDPTLTQSEPPSRWRYFGPVFWGHCALLLLISQQLSLGGRLMIFSLPASLWCPREWESPVFSSHAHCLSSWPLAHPHLPPGGFQGSVTTAAKLPPHGSQVLK